jgi:hypothetical protein
MSDEFLSVYIVVTLSSPMITHFSERNAMDRYLTPREASERLRTAWQVRQSDRRLANLRCIGGGPEFVKRGKWVLYPIDAVDAYGRSFAGPTMRSTHEVAEARAA